MKKEVRLYIFSTLLISAVFLAAYYFTVGPTAFAVFEQSGNSSFFGSGNYSSFENVSWNGSAVVLNENQITGSYVSRIFDANETVLWNNLSWTGSETLSFEIRSCSDISCSDINFSSANLTNLNATTRYLQYKVFFDSNASNESLLLESVVLDYTPLAMESVVSVTVIQPAGAKQSTSNIPLQFAYTGNNVTCIYSVADTGGTPVISNITLVSCGNSTFNIDEGSYVLTVYAMGVNDSAFDSLSFSVSVPDSEDDEDDSDSDEDSDSSSVQISVSAAKEAQESNVSLGEIADTNLSPGESRELGLSVQNSGTAALSCKLVNSKESLWLGISGDSKSISAGGSITFAFSVNVPAEASSSAYPMEISVVCGSISKNKDFSIKVVEKNFEFNITDVERARRNIVAVKYEIRDLSGENQNITADFSVFDNSSEKISSMSQNISLEANSVKSFRTRIPINESFQGEIILLTNLNSGNYSAEMQRKAALGSSITGFALLNDLGTGNIVIAISAVTAAIFAFFFVRKKISLKRAKKFKNSDSVSLTGAAK
jgi:hypothetical protein